MATTKEPWYFSWLSEFNIMSRCRPSEVLKKSGSLYVYIDKVTNLPSNYTVGGHEVYVAARVGTAKGKTRTLERSGCISWNETIDLGIPKCRSQVLIYLKSFDPVGDNKVIGQVSMGLMEFIEGEHHVALLQDGYRFVYDPITRKPTEIFLSADATKYQLEHEDDHDEEGHEGSLHTHSRGDDHGHAHGNDHGHSHAGGHGGHGGHSAHDGDDHGHSHGPKKKKASAEDHGHAHGSKSKNNDHGRSHSGGNDHGHAHGEEDHGHAHGEGEDHGHAHGAGEEHDHGDEVAYVDNGHAHAIEHGCRETDAGGHGEHGTTKDGDGHGHSHGEGDGDHGHAHGEGEDHRHAHGEGEDHGHAHGEEDHGHAHGEEDHGHAHGEGEDHGHAHEGEDHRHAHGETDEHAHSEDPQKKHGPEAFTSMNMFDQPVVVHCLIDGPQDHGHAHGEGEEHDHHDHDEHTHDEHEEDDHGHSHAGGDHGHAHGSGTSISNKKKVVEEDHGHSHAGGDHHGHSHGKQEQKSRKGNSSLIAPKSPTILSILSEPAHSSSGVSQSSKDKQGGKRTTKHVVILTRGTRGDVQPFVALAIGLAERCGWEITIVTEQRYKDFVLHHGTTSKGKVHFKCAGGDTLIEVDTALAKWCLAERSPLLPKVMLSRSEEAYLDSEPVAFYWCEKLKPDLVIFGMTMVSIATIISEKLQVPIVGVALQPTLLKESAVPLDLYSIGFLSALDNKIPHESLSEKPASFQERIENWMSINSVLRPVNKIRTQRRLQPLDQKSDPWEYLTSQNVPVIVPVNESCLGQMDLPANCQLTDFLFLRHRQPDLAPRMQKFVDDASEIGAPLVVLAFNSLPLPRLHVLRIALSLIEQCPCRPHVLALCTASGKDETGAKRGFMMRVDKYKAQGKLFEAQGASYPQLFRKTSVLVCNGGVGSTSEGLIAGVPIVVTGMQIMDQPFWGRRVHELGCGPEPTHIAKFHEVCVNLVEQAAKPTGQWRQRAKALSQRLVQNGGAKSGVNGTVNAIVKLMGKVSPVGAEAAPISTATLPTSTFVATAAPLTASPPSIFVTSAAMMEASNPL